MLCTQHHLDPGHNFVERTSTISSRPRFLHQLVHYSELSHIIGDEHPLDNYQLYVNLYQRYFTQFVVGDHNIEWISDFHSNIRFWSLSTETNRDHAGCTTVDIHSFSLCQNQPIGHHCKSHSTWHIDSYQRSTQGSALESRQLLCGSRCRSIQRECEYFPRVSYRDLSISLGLDVRLLLSALRIVSISYSLTVALHRSREATLFPKSNKYRNTLPPPVEKRSSLLFSLDQVTSVRYNAINNSRSSVTILAGSLESDRTYQFVVLMINLGNASRQATGFALVRVEDTRPQMVAVG